MKYIVNRKHKFKKRQNRTNSILLIDGYKLPTKAHYFIIDGKIINNIVLVDKKFAHPFVKKVAFKKYDKTIKKITGLFITDDDTDGSMNEVLNQIEKFKDEIKRKYRKYLKKKELEEMSLRLKFLQKEAKAKQMEIYFYENEKSVHHSR